MDATWLEDLSDALQDRLAQQAERTGLSALPGFEPDRLHLAMGTTAFGGIVALARKVNADLIVIGGSEGGALRRALVGSTADGVVRQSLCPVLVVHSASALEAFAGARARRDLTALLKRAPREVHRYENGQLTSPPIDDVHPGDLLLVKPGEVVPVDGLVEDEPAVLDESARLVPHEQTEDATVYPLVARAIGGENPKAAMSRAHLEIAHLVRLFGRLVDELPPGDLEPLTPDDGLHAILRLHFAQEEEQYLPLLEDGAARAASPLRLGPRHRSDRSDLSDSAASLRRV